MATIITKIFAPVRIYAKLITTNSVKHNILPNFSRTIFNQNKYFSTTTCAYIQENISSLQIKKRPTRKKKLYEEGIQKEPGEFSAVAFATAEEYKLESLIEGLKKQDLYEPRSVDNQPDVVHAVAKYQVDSEPREIFFFREGSVILWNITDLESSNILSFVKQYEQDSYGERIIHSESEVMTYAYTQPGKCGHLLPDGKMMLAPDENTDFEKYAFSNAMGLSVKLGVWEASLDRYVDSIEFVTEDLKRGNKIKMSREEVLRKHGELFALRHLINLSSDLLDTPDFYWDRDNLETIYSQTCACFSINRRTKVMNEKLNHCVELIELLSSHLSDKHHIRLEWMIIILIMVINEKLNHCLELIELLSTHLNDKHMVQLEWMVIILIMVEIVFEALHYLERYFA